MIDVQTGYFTSTTRPRRGRVHIVGTSSGAPVCGAEVTGSFQWCAPGVHEEYITCTRCKRWFDRQQNGCANCRKLSGQITALNAKCRQFATHGRKIQDVKRVEELAYQRGYHKGRLSNQQECDAIIKEVK